MDIFKEAEMIESMIDLYSLTQLECAKRLGKSQGYVANKLRLLRFSDKVRKIIIERGLSERHARLLLRLTSEEEIISAIDKISAMRLSVVASEVIVDGMTRKRSEEDFKNGAYSLRECVARFEEELSQKIREMKRYGIKAYMKISEDGRKSYITLVIEHTQK